MIYMFLSITLRRGYKFVEFALFSIKKGHYSLIITPNPDPHTCISGYHGGSELFLVFDEKTYLYTPSDTSLKLVSHYSLWCTVIGPGTR